MAKTGPKTRYRAAVCDEVMALGAEGKSIVQIAVRLGVPRTTLYQWAEDHPQFRQALQMAREASQAWWEDKIQAGEIGYKRGMLDPSVTKHVISCRFHEDYREHTRVDHGVADPLDRLLEDVAQNGAKLGRS